MNKYIKEYKMKKMLKTTVENYKKTGCNITEALAKKDTPIEFSNKYKMIQEIKNKISFYEDALKENYYKEIFSYEELCVTEYDSEQALGYSRYINAFIKNNDITNNDFPYGSWDYLYNMITIGRSPESCLKKYQSMKEHEPDLINRFLEIMVKVTLALSIISLITTIVSFIFCIIK